MKNSVLTLIVVILLFGCKTEQPVVHDPLIVLDVSQVYPEKEISLADIADITYLQLNDEQEEYQFAGFPLCVTGQSIVVFDSEYGDVLFFSKGGQPKSKFNRQGTRVGQYGHLMPGAACYDEAKDEFFALADNRIEVYTSGGVHLRTLSLPAGTALSEMFLLGDDALLLFDNAVEMRHVVAKFDRMEGLGDEKEVNDTGGGDLFLCVSRKNGRELEDVTLPHDHDVDLSRELEIDGVPTGGVITGRINHIVKISGGLLLHTAETDTLFLCSDSSRLLTPVMVQTPSMTALDPVVYINSFVETAGYQFIELIAIQVENGRYPTTLLVRDKDDRALYRQKILFDDYPAKMIRINAGAITLTQSVQEGLFSLPVTELRRAYANGELGGSLKTFVASLDRGNENDVLMLLQFK